jgi:hypothetical protein
MVNTFLTSFDYTISAKNLDNKRLGKQRVEAYQILNLVEDLSLLSQLFGIPMPLNPYLRRQWIRDITNVYKATGCYLFYHQNEWVWLLRTDKPYTLKPSEKTTIQDDMSILVYTTKQRRVYPKYGVLTRDDRLITLGFVYHPAVLMWLGYEESLKEYINACIDEWILRGNVNNLTRFDIKESNDKPIWVHDPEIHKNHKGALHIKEIARNEAPWYSLKDDFVEAGQYYSTLPILKKSTSDFNHYIWPYNTNDGRYPSNN